MSKNRLCILSSLAITLAFESLERVFVVLLDDMIACSDLVHYVQHLVLKGAQVHVEDDILAMIQIALPPNTVTAVAISAINSG